MILYWCFIYIIMWCLKKTILRFTPNDFAAGRSQARATPAMVSDVEAN
jgi:hypothetical protein